MSRTYLALLHYDGRDFAGWQRQPDVRTVQAEFEGVLARICGERVVAHGAGRTDAGVHALGLGVSCTVPDRWTAEELRRALNGLLPRDCWVERVTEMRPRFHARMNARGRRYRYDVGTDAASASPFRRPYEWALGRELDGGRLARAAAEILGTHVFRGFAAGGKPEAGDPSDQRGRPYESTSSGTATDARSGARPDSTTTARVPAHGHTDPFECTVSLAVWQPRDGDRGFRFQIAADRFLHHMVRFLVGTMVEIALGRRPVEDMARLLATTDNSETSPPAPPQGLYFVAADYPAELYLDPREASR